MVKPIGTLASTVGRLKVPGQSDPNFIRAIRGSELATNKYREFQQSDLHQINELRPVCLGNYGNFLVEQRKGYHTYSSYFEAHWL